MKKKINKIENKKYVVIDIETRSKADLTKIGAVNYAKDKSTEIIVLVYRLSTWPVGQVRAWSPLLYVVNGVEDENNKLKDLIDFIQNEKNALIVAHNWSFEYHIIDEILIKRKKLLPKKFNDLSLYTCTMSSAWRCGLKGSLDDLVVNLNLQNKKLTGVGSKLIQKYSKPDKKTNGFNVVDFETLNMYTAYCSNDVLATEELFNKLPKLHEDIFEWPIFEFAKIKQVRGFRVDVESLEKTIEIYENWRKIAEKSAEELCGVTSACGHVITSTIEFKKWLNERLPANLKVSDCQAFTLSELKKKIEKIKNKNEKINDVLTALSLRNALSSASVKKLYAFKNFTDEKNIARHQTLYHKALTGRETGFGIQPQNFPRLKCDFDKELQSLIDNTSHNVPESVQKMLRGFIIPSKPTKNFIVGDLSAIEARLTFWFAGQDDALQIYKNNQDIYKIFAALIYNVDVNNVTPEQRFVGKTAILSLGYGSGPVRFQSMLEQYGYRLDIMQVEAIVEIYRRRYDKVKNLWYQYEKAFRYAIGGETVEINNVVFSKTNLTVTIQLPSRKKLYFFKPKIENNTITYQSNDGRVEIWGGVILNNIVQATARNLIMTQSVEIENKIGAVVLNVHDEVVVEVEKKQSEKKLHEVEKILSTTPTWLNGLPLAAECKILERYAKI